MELIRGLHNLKPRHHGCVATIGNFDGVHLGHQEVAGQLAEKAQALRLPTLVILFEPQPQEFFRPDKSPPRLTRFREKWLALRRYSVDRVLCIRFDARFAAMEPETFVSRVLVDGLGVQHLVVGDDFRFGKNRRGDFALLQQMGQRHDFQVANFRQLCQQVIVNAVSKKQIFFPVAAIRERQYGDRPRTERCGNRGIRT